MTAEFESAGHSVTGTSTSGGDSLAALDLDRADQAERVLREVRPDVIVHLAGMQSVPESWRDPALAFRVNTGGTAALLRAIENSVAEAHLLLASTAAVYGDPPPAAGDSGDDRPKAFGGTDPVAPESPYAASKAAAEVLAGEAAERTGLAVTVARLFNQFGPGQPEEQVPAGFAASIAAAEAGGEGSVTIEVGNPDARRDYTDTRDTARAFRLVAERRVTGRLNFCSGRTHSLRRLIEGLSAASRIEVGIEHRPERANRNDVACFAGSPARLEATTGWQPRIAVDDTLAAMLEVRRRALGSD